MLFFRQPSAAHPSGEPQCPGCACDLELAAAAESSLRVCPRCVGLWVHSTTLRQFLEEPDYVFLPFMVPRGTAHSGPSQCPECRKPLKSQAYSCEVAWGGDHYRLTSPVQVKACKAHGYWLEPGDLRTLREWFSRQRFASEPVPGTSDDFREAELVYAGQSVSHGYGRAVDNGWRGEVHTGWLCYGPFAELAPGLWQMRWHFEVGFNRPVTGTMLQSDVVTAKATVTLAATWLMSAEWFAQHENLGRFEGYWDRIVRIKRKTSGVEYRLKTEKADWLVARRLEMWRL